MLVLVMGHRLPLARTLERLKIPYIVWSEKPLKNKLCSEQIIVSSFPEQKEDVYDKVSEYSEITHVIASVEKAVIPASNIRLWFKLKRNPHNLILKCTDKLKMKTYLLEKNIPMTKFSSSRKISSEEAIERLGFPIVSKPKLSSGGRGISFLRSREEVELAKTSSCYYEEFIEGTEGSVESFIVDNEIVFSNITEYYKNGLCNKVPGRYSDELNAKIRELNRSVVKALNIKWGMTHLEYYITDSGLYFGEIALRPPGGYIMEIISKSYNIDAWETFILVELGLYASNKVQLESYGSSLLIHPEKGTVASIEGVEDIKKLESLDHFKLNLKVGDVIGKRQGVGENFGYAFFSNSSAKKLDQDIKTSRGFMSYLRLI